MRIRVFVLLIILSACGCSTISESLSCKKTAADCCLTIDEVHAMTEEKGRFVKKQIIPKTHVNAKNNSSLWIAPYEDKGAYHA
jgi:hypothetical protein